MLIIPLPPLLAAPVDSSIFPDDPLDADPVFMVTYPLTPELPDAADSITTLPLVLVELEPLDTET